MLSMIVIINIQHYMIEDTELSLQQILSQVLTISNYPNKETFIQEFVTNCEQQALVDALGTLSQDKRDELKQKLLWAKKERKKTVLLEYISNEQYEQSYKHVLAKAMEEMIAKITPTMDDLKKKTLFDYLKSRRKNELVPSGVSHT